jgi:PAS domain S-box-containing protein
LDVNISRKGFPKEVSCRVTNSVLKYLEAHGYNVDSLLDGLAPPFDRAYLTDNSNWVPFDTALKISRAAAALTGDNAVMFKVGQSIPFLNPLGGIESIFRKLTGPRMVYKLAPRYSRLFDRTIQLKAAVNGRNLAVFEIVPGAPEARSAKESCYFAQGVLSAIPELWDLPPAEIREKKCLHAPPDGRVNPDVEYHAGSCVFEMRWQPLPSWYLRTRDNLLSMLLPASNRIRVMEESLRSIDRQNIELIARNKQLAAVREIAISVDKVRTLDEALTLTVEQSREIDGVRLVLVQKMDEARQNVITPYASRIRPDNSKVLSAIKKMGLDLEKMLTSPNGNSLSFPLSKLKVAQEYNKKPRVMIIPTVAELLDGVWPRALCDGIQKIVGIKQCVIIPLMVEGGSWGHMLFFLAEDVPVDILEMIGGHCAQAIKNIIALTNLEARNTELVASNKLLAAVREIAVGVDKVKTVDEALSLAVEQAREIDGIRFVLVQALDATGEYITTPYYSKIRRQNALKAIRAIGLDPEKELGKNPTSNRFSIKLSKVKIARDYIQNPRVIVLTSLAELLSGVWPRTICEAIQAILKVKKLVMVPLLVENKLWGNMLFFLTGEVPVDILEMISTHCAMALTNILNLDSLIIRNTELTASNKLLAAVREIAIGIDKVRTIDEALTLTVERSREIDGVRLVLVQQLDESREYVITPYYSKIRPESKVVVEAIKALGFDPEKEMGKSSTSKLLRFPFSKLKAAQDYVKNPRVIAMPSLAELLDGIWPGKLCDAIQKILQVNKLVIVPIMVEGESWGNMLFFLTHDVPENLLEMIGAHCAQAIKNIIYLNNLEVRNDELSALNRIAGITSKSLDMQTLLNDTVTEIKQIFKADAASVYVSESPGRPLKLVAQCGLPEVVVKQIAVVPLDAVPGGKFFTSGENIKAGIFEDFKNDLPRISGHLAGKGPTQYMVSVLHFGTTRYGTVTVLRDGTKKFGEDEQSLLLSIANQLALSLANSRLHTDVIKRADEAEAARNSLEELFKKHEITEAQLRDSEERYRTIFESANDLLILIDNHGRILNINARIEEIAGYSSEEILGKDFSTLTGMITPWNIAIIVKNFISLKMGKKIPVFDVEMLRKDGETRIIQINAVAVRHEGKIIGALAILRDVTDIKQAEENLRSQKDLIDRVLATIPNAVLLLDKDYRAVMVNEAFCSLFKVVKNGIEQKAVEFITGQPGIKLEIEKALKRKAKNYNTEIRYVIDSVQKILYIHVFPMKDENLLLVINDVTEEREKQERLYLTDRLASIGEMASGVAHELNNPLTSIIGLSGMLVNKDTPPSVKEDLDAIGSEAQRCAAIVRNLLTFARKHSLKKEPVQLADVVGDVLKLRAYEHKRNDITVENSLNGGLPKVLGDYYQMQQVFLNLILNAEAAMLDAHGRGVLKISAETAGENVKISFADNGPGIPRENLGLIFNPFFTTKEVGKGTGLGLSIVYGIITSHGGKVYAVSEPGNGATFVVELPAILN